RTLTAGRACPPILPRARRAPARTVSSSSLAARIRSGTAARAPHAAEAGGGQAADVFVVVFQGLGQHRQGQFSLAVDAPDGVGGGNPHRAARKRGHACPFFFSSVPFSFPFRRRFEREEHLAGDRRRW